MLKDKAKIHRILLSVSVKLLQLAIDGKGGD